MLHWQKHWQQTQLVCIVSDAMMFLPTNGGYKMWRTNSSPYPVYIGYVSKDNVEEEMKRQEALGFRVWISEKDSE